MGGGGRPSDPDRKGAESLLLEFVDGEDRYSPTPGVARVQQDRGGGRYFFSLGGKPQRLIPFEMVEARAGVEPTYSDLQSGA